MVTQRKSGVIAQPGRAPHGDHRTSGSSEVEDLRHAALRRDGTGTIAVFRGHTTQVGRAGVPASVGRRHRPILEDQHVEATPKVARGDFINVDHLEGEFEVLQDLPSPSGLHRPSIPIPERHPRPAKAKRPPRWSHDGVEVHSGFGGKRHQPGSIHLVGGDVESPLG